MTKTIHIVSGPIGSAKSRSFREWHAERIAKYGPIPLTLATPTNNLSNEHHSRFLELGVKSHVISQEIFRSASEEFKSQCAKRYDGVLICNNKIALNTSTDTANRILVLDESFSPLETIKIWFKSAEDVQELTVTDSHVDGYYEVVATPMNQSWSEDNDYKSYGKPARELDAFVKNQHHQVVIDKETFDAAISGEEFEKKKKKGMEKVPLQFTIFTLPTIVDAHKETIVLAANLERTMLALMWSRDVVFQSHKEIEDRLDYHDLSHQAVNIVLYNLPLKNLSQSFYDRLHKDMGAELFYIAYASTVATTFGHRPHIFCTNKNGDKDYDWALECEGFGERVMTAPHGWNSLSHHTMAVFGAAINHDPVTRHRLMAFYGITAKQAKAALCYEMVQQFIGRTAVRNKDNTSTITVVVPDEGIAAYIQELYGCAPSTPLELDLSYERKALGRPQVNRTVEEQRTYDRERKAAQRARNKAASAEQPSL
ncbi:hypothetical protein LH464_15640 [Neorhizobium sp. T786]|uniref:hypothetical protein n=1 Tax=Pseudorhizobium xiangyangii TaxID=2883104 RepID=UPI001D000DCE|nr:hypothetical protein [Neorhizobium xiangyangii]MCB5203904.1 hypothetical protein [Neorhizobium xiangyangii]